MSRNFFRIARRIGLTVAAIGFLTCLALTAYCAQQTARYVFPAQRITGTVVAVEKPVFEQHRQDYRPVVGVTIPSGETVTRRFTGLYRVPKDAVGGKLDLLYNPAVTPTLAPDSHLNWIGAMVYGGACVAFLVLFTSLWLTGRWIPALHLQPLAS